MCVLFIFAQSKHKKVWNLGGIFLSDPQWSAAHGVTWTHPWARAASTRRSRRSASVAATQPSRQPPVMWTTPSRAHGALLVTPSLLYGSRCASVRWPCLLCSLCVLPGYYVWTPAPRGLPTTTSWATTDTSSRRTTSSLIRTKVLPLSLLVVSKDRNKSTISKLRTAQQWKYHTINYSLSYDCLDRNKNTFMW